MPTDFVHDGKQAPRPFFVHLHEQAIAVAEGLDKIREIVSGGSPELSHISEIIDGFDVKSNELEESLALLADVQMGQESDPESNVGPFGERQTYLEKTYVEWLSARNDISETLALHPAEKLTKEEEKHILGPLYERADALEAKIVDAPCDDGRALAIKCLTAFAEFPELIPDGAVVRIREEAARMVNLTDAKTT